MTESPDVECFRPREAPIEMPYQVLERRPSERPWLALLRSMTRRAPQE